MKEYDESRMFYGPGTLKVYVPPPPPPRPDDYRRDFPPGEPPEVHYMDRVKNYWVVLREGTMPSYHSETALNEEQMNWLRGIEDAVEEMLRE